MRPAIVTIVGFVVTLGRLTQREHVRGIAICSLPTRRGEVSAIPGGSESSA